MKIKASAYRGTASFTMKRGSFKYKDRISKKTEVPVSLRREDISSYEYRLLLSADDPALNRFEITLPAGKDEHFYGCGETFSKFDLRGEVVRVWVAEHQNAARIGKKIVKLYLHTQNPKKCQSFDSYESYYAQPTFVSSAGYYVHVDTENYAEFDFSKAGQITIRMHENAPIYVGRANTFTELSERLSQRLGRQPELPNWVYDGIILGIQEGPQAIERKLESCREHGVPVSGVWSQDWCGCRRTGFGYQVMWNWEADKELYPDLETHIKKWKEDGVRFLGYINPFMAIEKPLYEYAHEHGYCVKDSKGEDYLVKITTFPAAMIDFTNPDAYEWYKSLIKDNMIGIGMGGWMADFGEYLPTDSVLFSGEDPYDKHNEWPAIWAKLNREAIQETDKEGEVFFFTRAGSTGTIAASTMMWNGDQHVDWSADDGLPSVIPATLSLALSGVTLTHSDIGGYTTFPPMVRDEELLLRWAEMNTFSPLMRSHEGNQPARNVQFDASPKMLDQLGEYGRTHVDLKEYIKDAVQQASTHGTPVMRPLFYHYDEPKAYTVSDEYLLGRDILVAPVIKKGSKKRKVWLPDDEWVHFYTGKTYRGGSHTVDAPVGIPPVFVRKRRKINE